MYKLSPQDKVTKKLNKKIKGLGSKGRKVDMLTITLKSISILVMVLLCVCLIGGVGLFYYLNQYAFDNGGPYMDLGDYVRQASTSAVKLQDDENITLTVNEEVFNALMMTNKEVIGKHLPFAYQIIDLSLDMKQGLLKINGRKGVSLVPVSAKSQFSVKDNTLMIELTEINLGSNASAMGTRLLKWLTKGKALTIEVPVSELKIFPNYLAMNQIQVNEQGIKITAGIHYTDIGQYVADFKQYGDPIILEAYEGEEDDNKALVLRVLKGDSVEIVDLVHVMKDIFGQQVLIKDFLYALDSQGIQKFYGDYGYLLGDSVKNLYKVKGEKVIQRKVEIANYLLGLLDNYLDANNIDYLNDGGILYDTKRQEHITLQSIKGLYEISSDVIKKEMESCSYYVKDEVFYVKYKLNEEQMLLVSKDTYQLTSIENANETLPVTAIKDQGPGEVKAGSEEAKLIKGAIQKYVETEDDLYFRFLNVGLNSAYALVSFENSYQTIHSYALFKSDEGWQALCNDMAYRDINTTYPTFDIKLIPPYDHSQVRLKQISGYGRSAIISELRYKGLYPGGSIAFCSYIGDYVFVQLTGGQEFVLVNEKGILKQALPRSEAQQQWELPLLLTTIESAL